ncbi:hypothetical protein ACIGHF_02855 [Stenotrophomonas sp. NPDC077464]|uniref:hypothetical protein n=1 Tax=unclassified Stenotrophomonas TaxID=196198 RepID=UPI0037D6773C
MGNYCKAYLLADLRRFPRWQEQAHNARVESEAEGGAGAARQLNDDDVVFVQESFVVTDGIFRDENVIFDAVDAEWMTFCQDTLGFCIPEDVVQAIREQAEPTAA